MSKKEQIAFLLQKNQKEIIDELTNEEAGIIFKAIYEYEVNKCIPKLDKTLNIVFKQFKVQLDNYDGAYKEKCLKNKENITNYWRQLKDTNEYERIQMNTNATNKRKINKIKENKIKENKRERENIYIISPTLADIINYAIDLGIDNKKYCETFYNHYESIDWVNGTGQKIKNWKLVFKNWVAKDNEHDNSNKLQKVGNGAFKL